MPWRSSAEICIGTTVLFENGKPHDEAAPEAAAYLQGTEIVASRPEEFGAYVKSEVQRWSELIKAAGITID